MQHSIEHQNDRYSPQPEQTSQMAVGSSGLMSGGRPSSNDLAPRPPSKRELGGVSQSNLMQEPSSALDLQHVENGSGNRPQQEHQAEHIIMGMWNRMRTLESKYIDLANYYKQELVSSSQNRGNFADGTNMRDQSAGGADIGQPGAADQQQPPSPLQMESQASLVQQLGDGQASRLPGEDGATARLDLSEDVIINELKSEKMRFEQNIKSIISSNGLQLNENLLKDQLGAGQPRQPQGQVTLTPAELVRFNMELEGAFKDILDRADQSQVVAVNNLGQRQTEMFQLATKHRLPSGFKSDAIGVWYDAKSSVTQSISKLKHFIQEKGVALMAQAFRPSGEIQDPSGLKKEDYSQLIQRFEEDMVALKHTTNDFNKSIHKIKLAIKAHDDVIKKDKNTVEQGYKELLDAIVGTNDLLTGRHNMMGVSTTGSAAQNGLPDSQPLSTRNQGGQHSRGQGSSTRQPSASGALVMSPFDKRMSSYQKSALGRSNSRGPSNSGGGQRPPKLAAQHSAQSRGSRKPSGSGATGAANPTSPLRGAFDQQDQMGKSEGEWHPDLRAIMNKLQGYDDAVGRLMGEQAVKQEKVEEALERVESQVEQALSRFLTTHETDLVKQFFTNTVLTPTETAHIVAKANLQAHATSSAATSKQPTNPGSSSTKRANQSSVSPYRQGHLAGREKDSQYRKTTPTRSKQAKMLGAGSSNHAHTPSKDLGNSSKFMQTGESVRLQELQTNTDQLFSELRRANDKYIEQQVENRKLKDQVQVLSLQIEDLRIHNNRYQMQAQNYQNQMAQRQKKTRTARGGQAALSTHEVQNLAQAPASAPTPGVSVSSGVHSQDTTEVLAEELELCKRIDLFFTAMKLLQRAVNRKEDISQLKVEFETKQRALQKLSKQIQTRINGHNGQLAANQHSKKGALHETSQYQGSSASQVSETIVQNKSVSSLRNRSQSTRAAMAASSSKFPSSASHRQTTSPLRPRTGSIRPKGPGKLGGVSPKPTRKDGQTSNRGASDKATPGEHNQEEVVRAQEQAEIIDSQRQQLLQMDQQLMNAKSQIAKLQQSAIVSSDEREELQTLTIDYRLALGRVEELIDDRPDGISQHWVNSLIGLVQSLRQDLSIKEREVQALHANGKGPLDLKGKLLQHIGQFESSLARKYDVLQRRLEQREAELDSVKRLFVEKLRVLESNFAEIGDHLIANQTQQQEQQKQDTQKTEERNILDQYRDDANESREQDEKAMEDLIQTNSQLHDEINELKRRLKDYADPQTHQKLQQDFKSLDEQVRVLNKEKQQLVKMFDTLSKERDTAQEEFARAKQEKQMMSVELAKMTQTVQSEKQEREKHDMLIEQSMKEIQLNLKDEIEQKICFQKEARDNDHLAKLYEEANESLQSQLEGREVDRAKQQHELEDCQARLKKHEGESQEHERVLEELHELESKYAKLIEAHDSLEEDLGKALEAKEELTKSLASAEADAQAKHDELCGHAEELKDAKSKLDEAQAQLTLKQDEVDDLLKELDQLRNKTAGDQEVEPKLNDTEITAKQAMLEKDTEIQGLQARVVSHQEDEAKFQEELDLKAKHGESLEKRLNDRDAEFDQLHNRLKEEANLEKQGLAAELSELKDSRGDLEKRLTSESEKTAAMQRQNWWLTALQLRVKRIVVEKMEKEQIAAQEMRERLQQKEEEQKEMMLLKDKELGEQKNSMQEAEQKWQQQLKDASQQAQSQGAELQSLEGKKNEILDKLKSSLSEQLSEKQAEIERMKEEMGQLAESKATAESNLRNSATEHAGKQQDLESQLGQHKIEIEKSSQELKSTNKRVEEKDLALQSTRSQLKSMGDSASNSESYNENLQKQIDDYQSQMDETLAKQGEKEARMKLLTNENTELQEQINGQKAEIEQLLQQVDTQQKDVASSKDEIENLKSKMVIKKAANDELMSKINQLEEARNQQGVDQDEMGKRLAELEAIKQENSNTISAQEEKLKALTGQAASNAELEEKLRQETEHSQRLTKDHEESCAHAAELKAKIEEHGVLLKTAEEEKASLNEKIKELELALTRLDDLEQENEQMQASLQNSDQELEGLKIEQEKLEKSVTEKDGQIAALKEQLNEEAEKLEKVDQKLEDAKAQIEKHEQREKEYLEKLDQAHTDMSQKVESGHNNVKQIVDIHKTNEELSSHLVSKAEQSKKLEERVGELEEQQKEFADAREAAVADLENQKVAYEVLLDKLSKYEEAESDYAAQIEELRGQLAELQAKNQQNEEEKQGLEERLGQLEGDGKGGGGQLSRNSFASDGDDYSSVAEMKDHLKHARQILISFFQKLPYSSPENEATLPIIYSMFEFTKDEQDTLLQNRMAFNQDKISQEVKDKSKKMFGKLFAKKKGEGQGGPGGSKGTSGSFNSGGNNTNNSVGNR